MSPDESSVLLSGKNSEGGRIFIKYSRTFGNIAQTTWIIPPTIIYMQCVRRGGAFTVSNTLVGRGDLFVHSFSRLLVSGIFSHSLTMIITIMYLARSNTFDAIRLNTGIIRQYKVQGRKHKSVIDLNQ